MKKITKSPVKFAVLTLREKDARTNKIFTRGKIVSKCYLLETKERYYPNGQVDTTYVVNFPFDDIKTYEDTMFSLRPNIGNPSFEKETEVDNVYDTYEEAKEELDRTNAYAERLASIRIQASGKGWKERMARVDKALRVSKAICSSYETRVLDATKDMVVEEKGRIKIK